MKYIETELKKRKGIVENEEQKVKLKNAEDSLYELPENIRVSSAKKTEEMLSNQMLSGIPEVDLGIEYVVRGFVGCGLNCQDEQLLIGRAAVWLGSAAPLWLCGGMEPCSGLVQYLAQHVLHSGRVPVQLHCMTFGKKLFNFYNLNLAAFWRIRLCPALKEGAPKMGTSLLPLKQSTCFYSTASSFTKHVKYHSSAIITVPKIHPLSTSMPTTLSKYE